MRKLFKGTLAIIMVILVISSSVPLGLIDSDRLDFGIKANAVEEGLSEVATVEPTAYGVLDTDVVATKVTLGKGYYMTSHSYYSNGSNYGEGYVIAEDNYNTFYLIGTKGVVKSFYSEDGESPKLYLVYPYSADNPYALYRVYNPETKKYDLYNANTCQYYEYGADYFNSYANNYYYEYQTGLIKITKDGKYGLINNKGQMLYAPIYDNLYEYRNCFIGGTKTGSYSSIYAILSRNGSTDGRKFYKDFLSTDYTVLAVREIEYGETWETQDYMDWAILNQKNLTLMTDFIYSDIEVAEYNGSYYCIGSRYFEATDYYGGTDIYYQHDIYDEAGNHWNVCDKYNCTSSTIGIYNSSVTVCANGLKIFITDNYGYYSRSGTGWINPDLEIPDFNKRYILATPDGKTTFTYSVTGTTPRDFANSWDNIVAIYGKCKISYESTSSGYSYVLYDSKENAIATVGSKKLPVFGNYLVYESYTNGFIYDYVNEKMIIKNAYIYCPVAGYDYSEINAVCFSQDPDSNKWAIFDAETGTITNSFTWKNNLYLDKSRNISNGARKLWCCYDSNDGIYIQVTDKGIILASGRNTVYSQHKDYLRKIKSEDYNNTVVEVFDYDGKLKYSYTKASYTEFTDSDIYVTHDTYGYGLASEYGTTIIDNVADGIGNCYNGLTYVYRYTGYNEYASVVDTAGNALMYGTFDISDYDKCYRTIGYSGFASFVKGNKEIYIYDFTACHGFEDDDSSAITEDDLFGKYNSFLNNNFYNSLYESAGNKVATALSHYGYEARLIAFTKSAVDGQTGYLLEKLINYLSEETTLNEMRVKEEMALEYLNNLDTESTDKILKNISKINALPSKINKVAKLDYNLKSEMSKVEFVKVWSDGTGFSSSEIYNVIEEATKQQKKLDAYFKATGTTIDILECVTSYLTVFLLQKGLVQTLMELVPQNTDLYEGLSYINAKQSKNGVAAALLTEFLTDEMLGIVGELIDDGLLALVEVKNANLASLILYVGGKIISSAIDSPTLEDIDKAILAYGNMVTLNGAVKNYQTKIRQNYSANGDLSLEVMKSEYSLLCDTFYKSIFTALSYAEKIAPEDEKESLQLFIDEYEKKLIYRSYIKTCLLNARTQWEYTVKGQNAVITKLVTDYPSGENRVPYMELYDSYFDAKNEMKNKAYQFEYSIDIPSSIDGYDVSAVGTQSFSDNSRVTGVYVPDTVTEIQTGAFKNCSQIDTVYLGESVETIGDRAFENCDSLSTLDIPDSVTSVGENSFEGVDNLLVTGSDENILTDIASDNITTQLRDLTPVKLEIITPAAQTEFNMQDSLDTTGLVVRVTYSDGSTKDITDEFYADIGSRVVGKNTVTVAYEGLKTEYSVNILASQCNYTISYQDDNRNTLSPDTKGTALAGSTLNITVPEISGYVPVNKTQTEIIGYNNNFVVRYEKAPLQSIESVKVTINDYDISYRDKPLDITVTLNGKKLKKDVDYTVKFELYTYEDFGIAVINGIGQYEGFVSSEFGLSESKHSFTKYYTYSLATCTQNLYQYSSCDNNCGYRSVVEVKGTKTDHTYSSSFTVDKNATCSEAGSKSRHCTNWRCSAKTDVTEIKKLSHTWSDWSVTTPATTEAEGVETRTCSGCKTNETRKIAKLSPTKIEVRPTDTIKSKANSSDIFTANNVTAADLLAVSSKNAKIVDKDGKEIGAANILATGMRIVLKDKNGTIIDEKTIVVPGDVEGDGKISAADARLALRASVSLENYAVTSAQYKASNVISTDKLSAADARLILRASVGLENPKSWLG